MKKIKIGKSRISILGILRTISQIIFFILLPALFVSVLAGIKELYVGIIHGSFDLRTSAVMLACVIAIIPVTAIAGRFFCGWMCAFGTMGEWIYALSKKITNKPLRINEKADRVLKKVKYVWLVLLIILVWTLGLNVFQSANPWDAFGMLLTPGQLPDIGYVLINLPIALVMLVLIIVASFFVERFFCRYLCPLGAIFAILSKLRILKIVKPGQNCGRCRICTDNCPMGIALYKADVSKSSECIECMRCVSGCPRGNVGLRVSVEKPDLKPIASGVAAVSVMTGLYFAGTLAADHLSAFPVTPPAVISSENGANGANVTTGGSNSTGAATANPASKYIDGTYDGVGSGYRGGRTVVSVTISNGIITDVKVISQQDTRQYFASAAPKIIDSIVSSQSPKVNTVSGATYSSLGIMQAVSDALSKALKA